MQKTTHKRIGRMIADDLAHIRGIRLDTAAFAYGCVLPDKRLRYMILHPHFFNQSFSYVTRFIRKTLRDMGNGLLDFEEFSLRLGVICHYIADFFCQAHNVPGYMGYQAHKRYEMALDRAMEDTCVSAVLRHAQSHRTPYLSIKPWTISQWLWRTHREYRMNPPSYQNDMEYAVTAQAVTVDHLVSLVTDTIFEQTL